MKRLLLIGCVVLGLMVIAFLSALNEGNDAKLQQSPYADTDDNDRLYSSSEPKRISALGVASLMEYEPQLIVLDMQDDEAFKQWHIEGVTHIPTDTRFSDIAGLIPNKNSPVVLICNQSYCMNNAKLLRTAASAGYSQVHYYTGGKDEWLQTGQNVALSHPNEVDATATN